MVRRLLGSVTREARLTQAELSGVVRWFESRGKHREFLSATTGSPPQSSEMVGRGSNFFFALRCDVLFNHEKLFLVSEFVNKHHASARRQAGAPSLVWLASLEGTITPCPFSHHHRFLRATVAGRCLGSGRQRKALTETAKMFHASAPALDLRNVPGRDGA